MEKKYIHIYERENGNIEIRYFFNEKEGKKIVNNPQEFMCKNILDKLFFQIENIKFPLYIIKKDSDFLSNNNTNPFPADLSFDDISRYLNIISTGKDNKAQIILDYDSDNLEICIEPTPKILNYFEIKDLVNGYINEKYIPKKEFINDEESKRIRNAFNNKKPKDVKAKNSNDSIKFVAIGVAAATILGVGHIISKNVEYEGYYKNQNVAQEDLEKYKNLSEEQYKNENKEILKAYENLLKEQEKSNNNDISNDNYDSKNDNFQSIAILPNEENNNLYQSILKKYGDIIREYSEDYGVDPQLMAAIITKESMGLSSNEFNDNGSIGLCQIQNVNLGEIKKAYNVKTLQNDFCEITLDKIKDDRGNIQCGTMIMADLLQQFNGNVIMALQAYNYGPNAIINLVSRYANDNLKTIEQVINENDYGWLSYRVEGYANYKYVEDVLSCINPDSILKFNIKGNEFALKISSSYEKNDRIL